MMKNKILLSLSITAISGNTIAQRPNIILFMVDDMGWQDTSLPFGTDTFKYNRIYETPNMERLASQGMMFTQAYSCSISSPSRCSLITGVNNARHRVTNWTLEKNKPTDEVSSTIITPNWNCNGISMKYGEENTFVGTSFVEKLRENGYTTIHCGKAHFGAEGTYGADPCNFGFEVNIAGHAAGGLATYLSELNYGHTTDGKATSLMSIPGLEKYWGSGVFVTEALTREAIKALDKADSLGKPFFLYMSHYAVHIPIDKDVRYYEKYINKGLTPKEAAYASLIEGMDKSLGDILDWVDRSRGADNTVVIFMSDNGGLASQPYWRDGEPYTQNYPLSSGKGSLYEGGIREPMIVKWPEHIIEGTKCDNYLMIEDFYPSILDMANISYDKDAIDGYSFVPLIRGNNSDVSKNRALYWNFPNIWGNEGPGINLNCAIRQGRWKLIYYYETGKKELFDIPFDIGEKSDLSEEYPELVKMLSKKLGRYLRSVDADRPIYKLTNKPCPWPDEI